jgi:T-complex protein 1 subunit alpha
VSRRCKKSDLKRIAKATGAQFITSLANVEGEESFEAAFLGEAAEVSQERISGQGRGFGGTFSSRETFK